MSSRKDDQGCASVTSIDSATPPEAQNFAGCAEPGCDLQALQVLTAQTLCMQHFFSWCYQRLDSVEELLRTPKTPKLPPEEIAGALKECTDQALLVCLRHTELTNMDRARLLNILLHSWDLTCQVKPGKDISRWPKPLSLSLRDKAAK